MKALAQLWGVVVAMGVLGVGALHVESAAAHQGGRYGTVGDMERTLKADQNVLEAVCNGFGTARNRGAPKLFWTYKHFHCWAVINTPYRQLCMTVHTRRNSRIVISRAVRAGDALPGDCG